EIDNGAVRALANSPSAAGLRKLVLRSCRFADRGMRDLAASPHLAGLTSLSVYGSTQRWRGAGVRALAESKTLRRLEHLDLGGVDCTVPVLAALCSSPILAGVSNLSLSTDQRSMGKALATLVSSPHPRRMNRLDLAGNDL